MSDVTILSFHWSILFTMTKLYPPLLSFSSLCVSCAFCCVSCCASSCERISCAPSLATMTHCHASCGASFSSVVKDSTVIINIAYSIPLCVSWSGTPLQGQLLRSGHYLRSQLHGKVYKTTPEMMTPIIRTLQAVSKVSTIERFHDIKSMHHLYEYVP